MCNPLCISFVEDNVREYDVRDMRVLEVGSMDVNGSIRPSIEKFKPHTYIGVDIVEGPRVDFICNAENLIQRFGKESFDIVVSSEMLEHVRDWRLVVSNLKKLLVSGGLLIITTRSKGKLYHAYPHDFWRFETEDMKHIFKDFKIEVLEKDPYSPGVFLKAWKPIDFSEETFSDYELFSIIIGKRVRDIDSFSMVWFRTIYSIKNTLKRILPEWAISIVRSLRESL